jgi:hypothetical protein
MLLAINVAQVGQVIVNLLAIAGGFLVGQLVTHWSLRLLGHLAFRRQPPEKLLIVLRVLGGVLLAILVALIVFGEGSGFGLFSAGGDGKGGSPKVEVKEGTGKTDPPKKDEPVKVEEKSKQDEPKDSEPERRATVTLLGGQDVRDDRFYLLDGDRTAKTLAEVKAAVEGRQKADPGRPVKLLEIRVYRNSVARSHQAVRALEEWATETKMDVKFPAVQDRDRP